MPNRLAGESSPYLLQHKDNPIDWFPWGEEAFAMARAEDKPIFLSVGYSSCHWCHVMAHESFEDEQVAAVLNRFFVSIKLDREERPDVDDAYMSAVQMATGHGGWPMTVFLTPDRRPFFTGTYFPRDARGRMPGFLTILSNLASSWNERRAEIEASAQEFSQALREARSRTLAPSTALPVARVLDEAVEALHQQFDYEYGGFGPAPKFPPHSAIEFLLDYAQLRPGIDPSDPAEDLVSAATQMALKTLEIMSMSGLHDHVGGGFHRYATDRTWLLPHFEKMLNDNGQLLFAYSRAEALVNDGELATNFGRVKRGLVEWIAREMTSAAGVFYAGLDADSEGEEGLFYVWTMDQLRSALGDRAADFAEGFACEEGGNSADESTGAVTGANVLYRIGPDDFPAERERLLAVRESRVRPGLDNKAICAWNGLVIRGLVEAGELEMADRCASVWLSARVKGRLPHQMVNGIASGSAFLDDYAYFLEGLTALRAAQNAASSEDIVELLEVVRQDFEDDRLGGFYFSSKDGEDLFGRPKPFLDNASPSPNGVLLRLMISLGLYEEALPHLASAIPWALRVPTACETIFSAMTHWLDAHPPVTLLPTELTSDSEIRVTMAPREVVMNSDGWAHVMVTISLPPGVHINTNEPPAKWLSATQLKVEGALGEAGFPESEDDRYEGEVAIPVRLKAGKTPEEFQLTVTFQPCTETECQAPMSRVFSGVILPPQG